MTFRKIISKCSNQIGWKACLIACILLSACSNDMEKINFFDRKTLPDQVITNGHINRSERGHLQMHLDAELIKQYSGVDARTIYPNGLELRLHDSLGGVRAFVRADYGISFDSRNILEVRDSVVIIDYQSGDTSYLQDLTWDKTTKRVYTNNPLRSINGQRITYGDGFHSDDDFNNPIIVHQRGTIEWNEEEEGNEL